MLLSASAGLLAQETQQHTPSAGNTAAQSLAGGQHLVPSLLQEEPGRHLLQEESPPPPTAAAELVDGVGALSVQPPWRLFASCLPVKRSGPAACLPLTHLQHSHCVCTRGHLPAQLQQPPLDALDLSCRSRRLARAWLGDC